ncbi:hypothetical protein PENTCL1PPCAC_19710, partial [Pristionchus entomophagus]
MRWLPLLLLPYLALGCVPMKSTAGDNGIPATPAAPGCGGSAGSTGSCPALGAYDTTQCVTDIAAEGNTKGCVAATQVCSTITCPSAFPRTTIKGSNPGDVPLAITCNTGTNTWDLNAAPTDGQPPTTQAQVEASQGAPL